MSNFIEQKLFLSKLQDSVNSTYGTEAAFTLIAIEVKAETRKYNVNEALGLLSSSIKKALIKEKDCYSYWSNTFYILTFLDNNRVVNDFTNSLATKIKTFYGNDIYIEGGFIQYPYDILKSDEIFFELKSTMHRITVKHYDAETGLITDTNYNQTVSEELVKCLESLKKYDDVLYNHSLFVAITSAAIARELNLSKQVIKKIVIAGILHDIGYLLIPKVILMSKSQTNMKYITLMKLHPILATRRILKDKAMFKDIFFLIEQHHEYLDGDGYPFGLSRSDISAESQIISISDTYALVKNQRNTKAKIIDFFTARAGIRWDEKPIKALITLMSDEKFLKTLDTPQINSLVEFFKAD